MTCPPPTEPIDVPEQLLTSPKSNVNSDEVKEQEKSRRFYSGSGAFSPIISLLKDNKVFEKAEPAI
ncbi:hypothetical protein OS31_43710 [Dickeya oryzae]